MRVPRIGMVLAAGVGMFLGTREVWAEELPPMPKLAEACRAGWLSVQIVSGRINLAGTRFGSINTTAANNGRTERLTIHSKFSGPSVTYEMSSAQERLLIELSGGNQMFVQWLPRGTTPRLPIEYRQSPGKPVTLRIGPETQAKVLEAASLWHLLVIDPDLGRQYVVPLMRAFQADVDPVRFVEELESELTRSTSVVQAPSRQRWSELVQQLGDERFARRQAADHELRQAGRLVATYLEQLDLAQLDAEQQYRVRRILDAISESSGMDTPVAMATWLSGDPSIWLALLERESAAVRQVARERLEGLLGTAIALDPQATREARHEQVEQLRAQLRVR
jgi:hypothetical protein